jgi:hypothetical protein
MATPKSVTPKVASVLDRLSGAEIKQLAGLFAKMGENGDTILAHITPEEAAMLKQAGGSGTPNPKTGLPQFYDADDNGNAADPGNPTGGDTGGSGGGSTGGPAEPAPTDPLSIPEAPAEPAPPADPPSRDVVDGGSTVADPAPVTAPAAAPVATSAAEAKTPSAAVPGSPGVAERTSRRASARNPRASVLRSDLLISAPSGLTIPR